MLLRQLVLQELQPLNDLHAYVIHDLKNEYKSARPESGPCYIDCLATSFYRPYESLPEDMAVEDALDLTRRLMTKMMPVAEGRRRIHTGCVLANVEEIHEQRRDRAKEFGQLRALVRACGPAANWRGGAAQEAQIRDCGVRFFVDVMKDGCLRDGDTNVLLEWPNRGRAELRKALRNLPLPPAQVENCTEELMNSLSQHAFRRESKGGQYVSGARLAMVVRNWGDATLADNDIVQWNVARFVLIKIHLSLTLRNLFPLDHTMDDMVMRYIKLCEKMINFPRNSESSYGDLFSTEAKSAAQTGRMDHQ